MNNKLSQRKKPKQNNTWSCSTSSYYLKEQAQEQETQHNFISNTSIEDRIDLYEHKYKICMQSRTELSSWIKSNKTKGMPAALTEGYSPPSSSKSKLFSTRPTAISSLSTFLKKATSYNNNKGSTNTPTTHQHHHRFSLTSSLNRFSLPKNNCNNVTEKYQIEEQPQQRRHHRFSTPLPETILPTSKSTQIKSSILPHSPSSVFLDKLRSKVPHHEAHHIEPNFHEETEHDTITPPSSPSSTGSHHSHPSQYTFRQSTQVLQSPEKKKKRASLLITPSLSSLRLMSQKSHFLKRQSMLA